MKRDRLRSTAVVSKRHFLRNACVITTLDDDDPQAAARSKRDHRTMHGASPQKVA